MDKKVGISRDGKSRPDPTFEKSQDGPPRLISPILAFEIQVVESSRQVSSGLFVLFLAANTLRLIYLLKAPTSLVHPQAVLPDVNLSRLVQGVIRTKKLS